MVENEGIWAGDTNSGGMFSDLIAFSCSNGFPVFCGEEKESMCARAGDGTDFVLDVNSARLAAFTGFYGFLNCVNACIEEEEGI